MEGLRIIKATAERLEEILSIYGKAREYMKESGNPNQWGEGYPSRAIVESDLIKGQLYLCVDGEEILGVFCYFAGDDPTYAHIYNGEWRNTLPYGVMHRVAVARHQRGVASFCFAYCYGECHNLKIDTHTDNLPMHRALEKNGFVRCGTIYLENGDARIAYQRCED